MNNDVKRKISYKHWILSNVPLTSCIKEEKKNQPIIKNIQKSQPISIIKNNAVNNDSIMGHGLIEVASSEDNNISNESKIGLRVFIASDTNR